MVFKLGPGAEPAQCLDNYVNVDVFIFKIDLVLNFNINILELFVKLVR